MVPRWQDELGFWSSLRCGFDGGGAIFILVPAPHDGKMATNNPESTSFFLQTQGRRSLEVPLEEWKIFPQASRNLSSVSHWPEVGCMSIPEAGNLAENTVELLSRTLTSCPRLALGESAPHASGLLLGDVYTPPKIPESC